MIGASRPVPSGVLTIGCVAGQRDSTVGRSSYCKSRGQPDFWVRVAILAMLLAATSPACLACALPRRVVVNQAARVRFGDQTLTVAALSLPDLDGDDRSQILVLDARCKRLWSEQVDGLESRFEKRVLGGTELLEFITMQEHGDGTGYVHRLYSLRNGRMRKVPPEISHTGKDGFYLGPLGSGQGEGIVTWIADPTGEAEASAHPYVVNRWRWHGGHFTGPSSTETTRKFLPSNEVVPRADIVAHDMGLPYFDQTGTGAFMDPARVFSQKNNLETH